MQHNLNVVGKNIAKLRQRRRWTREELAAKLQLLGCNITPGVLIRIESGRCIVTDAQIVFFSEVFDIPVEQLYPPKSQFRNGEA
jgi:transcriptional regulator with XRE-family HTH domain